MKNIYRIAVLLFICVFPVSISAQIMTEYKPDVIIADVFYDTPLLEGVSGFQDLNNGEYITLYNTTDKDINIGGWTIECDRWSQSLFIPFGMKISAKSTFVLVYSYKNKWKEFPWLPNAPQQQVYYQSELMLPNGGATITLKNQNRQIRDCMIYDGTSNESSQDRLHATNADGFGFMECLTLKRSKITYDLNGSGIALRSDWRRSLASPFIVSLAAEPQSSMFSIMDDKNYIITRTYQEKTGRSSIDLVEYFNGLGYLEQTVQVNATPRQEDLTVFQQYDIFKRKSKTWLPAVSNDAAGAYTAPNIITSSAVAQYNDTNPFFRDIYDTGEFKRQRIHFGPGEIWQWNGAGQRFSYMTNNNTDTLFCRRYKVEKNEAYNKLIDETSNNPYQAGDLTVIRYMDEDGNRVFEFKDGWDRTILKRVIDPSQEETRRHLDTYFVYDIYGNLCFVLPPTMALLTATTQDMEQLVVDYGYSYTYDPFQHRLSQRFPGGGETICLHDDGGRLTLYQTPNMKAKKQWYSIEYDNLNRIIKKEIITFPYELTTTAIYKTLIVDNNANDCCQRIRNAASKFGYTENYWYSEYPSCKLPFQPVSNIVSESEIVAVPTGLKTVEQMPIYGKETNSYVSRTYYYDHNDQLRQIVELNHLGGYTVKSFKYNYIGLPITTQISIQPGPEVNYDRITTTYTYDHANRLQSEYSVIDNQNTNISSNTVRTSYSYDTFGRLVSKQSDDIIENYRYDIRNRETLRSSDYFTMQLAYEQPTFESSVRCYNGNISEATWQYGMDQTADTYTYYYDYADRLADQRHIVNGVEEETYSLRNIEYDADGNILQVIRYAAEAPLTSRYQRQEYSYTNNRLTTFKSTSLWDGTNILDNEYTYDAAGNVVQEGSRNITYNLLNLTETITTSGRNFQKYYYLCDGTKLGVITDGYTVDYLEGCIYITRDGQKPFLESAPATFGRWIFVQNAHEGQYVPRYYLNDYQGSVRAIVEKDAAGKNQVIEIRNYDPFGRPWTNAGTPVSDNRFQYNGKESLQAFGHMYLDYGARLYNPTTRRWLTQDPLADKRPSIAPFVYCSNNPVNRIDNNGQIDWPLAGYMAVNKKDYSNGGWSLKNAVVRTSLYMEERNIGTSPHIGIDYRAAIGTPVYSLGDGKVVDIGQTTNGIKFITIEYGNGDMLRFMHMNSISSDMKVGGRVFEGQIIGESGNSGTYKKRDGTRQNYQPHLHVDAVDKEGNRIDPEATKYGNFDSKTFFEKYNGDYLKLIKAKKDVIDELNKAGLENYKNYED